MDGRRIRLVIVLLLSVTFSISACRSTIRYTQTANPRVAVKHTGPPPHAPAHGYRHRHSDGVDLVYKSDIGVYIVVGHTHHYYCKDRFYRLDGGSWEVCSHLDGKWTPVSEKKLPKGLHKKHVCKKGKK